MAIQASFETANAEGTIHDPATSSSGQITLDYRNVDNDLVIQPSESLGTSSSELSSRYLQALGQNSRNSPLQDSSFPPLPIGSVNGQPKTKHESEGSSSNTMAAHLRRHSNRNVSVLNSAHGWPVASRGSVQSSSNPTQSRKPLNVDPGVSGKSSQTRTVSVISSGPAPSTYASSIHGSQRTAHGHLSPVSSREKRDNGRIVHSVSAPNLIESGPLEPSFSDFPPVSAAQVSKLPASSQSLPNVEDVHTANKSLVEKIRSALDFDQDIYSIFKDISAQYRQGIIDTGTYLDYVQQFGLSHLVLELARLCPDPQKQKELVDSYNASLQRNALQENGWGRSSAHRKDGVVSRKAKGKGKSIDTEERNSKEKLEDSFLSTVRQLQLNYKPSEENAVVLSKGDYRTTKGKSKVLVDEQLTGTNSCSQPITKLAAQSEASGGSLSNQNKDEVASGSKQRKKTSKFLRARLGDGSAEALFDHKSSNTNSEPGSTDSLEGNKNDPVGVPVRGVWRNRGGHKLFS